MTASVSWSGETADKMASAAFVPTPVTPMSSQRSPEKLDHAAPKLRT